MFYIVYVENDNRYRAIIDKSGKANRYGEALLFKKRKDAEVWIARRTYPFMSYHYEIKEKE